jgi:exodeoxyribonuclease-3
MSADEWLVMRIATFNCNSIRSRMDAILGWLRENKPDVLCLQETKVQDHEFPRGPIEAAGYHVVFSGMKAYNGVAILSRSPPAGVCFGLDSEPSDPFRLAAAEIDGIAVVNTYVPQGRDIEHAMFRYKIDWFRRLRAHFDRRFKTTYPLVWVGDCNVAAEPMDVHNPEEREGHVCFHADARAAFAECRAWGFVDVFRKFHPEPGQYTFFDYRTAFRGAQGEGWRLDYILASPALAKRAIDCRIDLAPRLQPKASDHTVVLADFA